MCMHVNVCTLFCLAIMVQIVYFARAVLLAFIILVAAILLRLYYCILGSRSQKTRLGRKPGDTCTFAVFLGSGVPHLFYIFTPLSLMRVLRWAYQ